MYNSEIQNNSAYNRAYNFLLAERSDMYLEKALDDIDNTAFQSSLYVALEANNVYHKMFQNIGIQELREFVEADSLVLYEGAKFDAVKNAIIKFFKGLFDRIKKFFSDVLDKIDNMRHKYWTRIGSNLKEITPKELNDLDNEEVKSSIGTVYKYDFEKFNEYAVKLIAFINGINKYTHKFVNKGISKEKLDSFISKEKNAYIKKCIGISTTNPNALRGKLYEKHESKIDVDKNYIIKNWEYITNVVKGGNIKRYLKKSYDSSKKAIDDIIKEIEGLDGENSTSYIIEGCSSLVKDITVTMNTLNSIHIDMAVKEFKINQMIAFKVAKMLGKFKEIKKKK